MQAYQISRDSNPKGPLRRENVRWTLEQQRLQTCEACAGGRMHSIRKSPSWRANKNSSSTEELFLLQAYQISRDSNPKGPLRRENVRWTLEQQRLQTCEACAGGRMHSIRKSPSWRANKNSSSTEELFLLPVYHSVFRIFSRMRPRTFFSILDTCTCDIPSTDAICCCVMSRK